MNNRWIRARLIVAIGLLAVTGAAGADDAPAAVDPDLAVQGEYVGSVGGGDDKTVIGVQVIALGDGKFHAVGYQGGLPGEGASKEKPVETDGERSGGIVIFEHEKTKATIDGDTIRVEREGQPIGELKKVERKSPTLGQKPPQDAQVLFNGSTAEFFKGGRLSTDHLLKAGATSIALFQDVSVHLEFQTPFMPKARGQARGNSGCYLQGRYEVQVLDSFGLEGKNNECGGIYEIKAPDVNMCFPPTSWQTYDIGYKAARYNEKGEKTANARITVKHNGVLIHDNVEIPRGTRAAPVKEGPEPGPLYLQDHGNPVMYRNIWIVPVK